LEEDIRNVVVVHCLGKIPIRTALVISCFLVKHRDCGSASEAMQMFGKHVAPLDDPIFRRYAQYFAKCVENGFVPDEMQVQVHLHKMVMHGVPNFSYSGGSKPLFSISQDGRRVFFQK